MGQSESKSELKEHYPFYPTDFEIKRIINRTDLDRNEIQLLWNHVWLKAVKENGKVDFENFVKYFCQTAWVRMQVHNSEYIHCKLWIFNSGHLFQNEIYKCFLYIRAPSGMKNFLLKVPFH